MAEIDVAAALRGNPWPGSEAVPYPRADPENFDRLPIDTWTTAGVPAGVRLELLAEAVDALTIDYTTSTAEFGHRGEGAGVGFEVWNGDTRVGAAAARLGRSSVTLDVGGVTGWLTVYLPEAMRPTIHGLATRGGAAEAAPPTKRWVCYGDSIAEGWAASSPSGSWPAIVARRYRLDLANLGYAGAARGEVVSAEHVAELPADVISLSHGTNCWTRTPHSAAQVTADYEAFLTIVRSGHPDTPIVCVSPVVRPDGESTLNKLGASLAHIRAAIEGVVDARQAGDGGLQLIRGRDLIRGDDLVDGVHPGDVGHARLAEAIGPVVAAAAGVHRARR